MPAPITVSPSHRLTVSALLALTLAIVPGCLQRTLSITTEPPGALVWLNDVEVGTTPLETDFTYYGGYDLRLRRPGYEPILLTRKINPPIYERPGLDLISEMIPARIENRVEWHFALTPSPERSPDTAATESEILARAHALRAEVGPPLPSPTSPAPATTP